MGMSATKLSAAKLSAGKLSSSKLGAIAGGTPAPSGYTVSWDAASYLTTETAASFTMADAEVGSTLAYTVSSSGGGTPISDSLVVAAADEQVTDIDLAGLSAGTLTVSVTLTNAGGTGAAATDDVALQSSLVSGLVSWWSFDEESGARVDSHGSNDLTDNNSVGSATGLVGAAASFVAANSEYLSRLISVGSSWAVAVWVKPSTNTQSARFIKLGSTNSRREVFNNTGFYNARIGSATIIDTTVPVTDDWTLIVFGDNGTNGWISVNGGAKITDATSLGAFSNQIIAFGALSGGANGMDGLEDEAALWSREPTDDEIAELYNSGDGIPYPG